LKKRYGVGYHMVMVKTPTCDPKEVTDVINGLVPTAKLESNVGKCPRCKTVEVFFLFWV